MRFVRFTDKNSSKPIEMKGILDGEAVYRVYGSFFKNYAVDKNVFIADRIDLLPPILPSTIMCLTPSYAKSPASLSGSGARVQIPPGRGEYIYCLPRAAFVLKDLSNNINSIVALFGVSLMLDFFKDTADPAATASFDGYTVLGPSLNTETSGETAFYVNGQTISKATIPKNEYTKAFEELSPVMKFHAGDIVALPLVSAPYKCGRGDTVTVTWGQESLRAALV